MKLGPLAFLFLLEVILALLGGLWMWLANYPLVTHPDPWGDATLAVIGYFVLLGLELLAEQLYPAGYKQLESLIRQLGSALKNAGVDYNMALTLALASAIGEELWFRGALQNFFSDFLGPYLGLAAQAILFAAGHPAPGKAGRFYMIWAFAAGLVFGGLYLYSGSLIPGILAHFLYNAKGFSELYD